MCVCSLNYPARKPYASYYIAIWGLSSSTIFFLIISWTARFSEKRYWAKNCVLIFSITFVWNISHSKNNQAIYHKCILVFVWSTRYSCQIVMKLEFSQQIFEKCSNIKFHENPSSGSRVVAWGRTEGQTEGQRDMKLMVAFRNFANAPKTYVLI